MIRIVCPFCHIPLAANQLETATYADQQCLVCPECENVLGTEGAPIDGHVSGNLSSEQHATVDA
jgi:hypothetical protein